MKHVGVLLVLSLIWLAIYVVQRPLNYFVRSSVRTSFRKLYPEGRATCRWWIDEGSFDSEGPLQRTSTSWDAFSEVAETPEGFLIYDRAGQPGTWLPAQAFGSAESVRKLADLAKARVPNYVVLGECKFPAKTKPAGLEEL